MPDVAAGLADFRRYAALLESMIPTEPSFAPTVESSTSIQV